MASRLLIALVALLLVGAAPPKSPPQTRPTTARAAELSAEKGEKAVVIVLKGEINDFNRDSVFKRFKEARDLGAKVVILKVNTYGGLVTSGLDISRFLKQQTDVHTVAFVEDKAISAGALISLACDEIVMQPHALLGDTGVISMAPGGGISEVSKHTQAKMESPVLEDFRDSAQRNGYSPLLVQSMVNLERTVYYVQNAESGERRFVDKAAYDKLTAGEAPAWKDVQGVPVPIDGPDSLLIVSTELALKLDLAKGEYAGVEDFAKSRGLDVVATLQPAAGENLLGLLGSDAVRGIVTAAFMFSIYAAFSHPGTGVAEAIAAVCLAVLLGVPLLTGYAQWWEVLAVLLGIGLLALELFVIPGFGVAGISGILLILGGLAMTFVGPLSIPSLPGGGPGVWTFNLHRLRNGLATVTAALAGSLLLWFWLSRYIQKTPFARGLILTTVVGSTTEQPPRVPGSVQGGATDATLDPLWPAVGAVGRAVTDLRPGGGASFATGDAAGSRVLDVVSDRGFVRNGVEVAVKSIAGRRVVVREVGA